MTDKPSLHVRRHTTAHCSEPYLVHLAFEGAWGASTGPGFVNVTLFLDQAGIDRLSTQLAAAAGALSKEPVQ